MAWVSVVYIQDKTDIHTYILNKEITSISLPILLSFTALQNEVT